MKEKKLTVVINQTPHFIFSFLLNPENTPKWIPSFLKEETNEQPTRLGTIYRNTTNLKDWDIYYVSEFEQDELFTFTSKDENYHCRYTLFPIGEHQTRLEYYEWVENGDLQDPFSQEYLTNLKTLLE